MKTGSRFLGIDDAAFEFEDEKTFLTGVVYRGTEFIEDIKTVEIPIDGSNSTRKVIDLHDKCNNTRQIKALLLDGVSFGGFNVVNISKVSEIIEKPVIAVTSNKPDPKKFKTTMEDTNNLDPEFNNLPDPEKISRKEGELYIQFSNCSREEAKEIIDNSVIHGLTPEPIRVADMIGKVFSK